MITKIFILFYILAAIQIAQSHGYGYSYPKKIYARTCQYFQNGLVYRGPCRAKSFVQKTVYGGGGYEQAGGYNKVSYPVKPVFKPVYRKPKYPVHHKPQPPKHYRKLYNQRLKSLVN